MRAGSAVNRGRRSRVTDGLLPMLASLTMAVLATTAVARAVAPAPDLAAVMGMIEAGRSSQAEQALRAILADQDASVARDLLGVVLSQQGRFEEAEDAFRRAIDLAPELLAARQHLGRLYLQQQRSEQALEVLRDAADLGRLERDLAFWLATAELAAGNPDAAERQLRSSVERFDSVKALLELAKLQARRGERTEATQSLRRALELAPNSEEVLSGFARLSLAAREPVPAIRALEPLTLMHPSVSDHAHLLGVARLQIGENDGAVEALQRALDLEPDRVRTLTALGLAFNNQKQFSEASEALGRALELRPENVEALAALAEAEEGLGELQSAEEHALRALAKASDHAVAHLVIGKVRMNQQRYAEARDALKRAVAADATSAKAHYQLSLAYARLQDP